MSYYDYDFFASPCEIELVTNFGKVFLPVLYILVFILGYMGNGLVACVLLNSLHRSNLTDLCLLNLAVSDLLFLLTLPLYVLYVAASFSWVIGDFMCHISGGLHSLGFYSSTFFMVVMTLDRYVLIQHAQKSSKYRSMKTGMILSMFVWALSFLVSLPAFIFTITDNGTCDYDPESEIWIDYRSATNILCLALSFIVMLVCYSRILPTLTKMRSTQKHRSIKLIVCVITVFFLFWTPYNITLFLDFLRLKNRITDSCELHAGIRLSLVVTEPIAFSHCCLNPVIYAFAGQKFKKRSVIVLRKLLSRTPASRDRADTSIRMSSIASRTSVTTSIL
ncbi:unnamed protein product [Knipowitschia caucasica]